MRITILSTLLMLLLNIGLRAQNEEPVHKVEYIEKFNDLYRYQEYYIAGQPSLDALKWLREEGVTKVINLRTENENDEFTSSSFDEEALVKELGMEYYSVPVSGRSGYNPKKLKRVGDLIGEQEKVLIHCGGAGRATNFLMGFLIQYRNYTIDQAVDVGQELTFFLPLENLLDIEITMQAR